MAKVEIVPRAVKPVKVPVDVVLTLTEQEAGAIKALLDVANYKGSEIVSSLYRSLADAGIMHDLSEITDDRSELVLSGQFMSKYGKIKES